MITINNKEYKYTIGMTVSDAIKESGGDKECCLINVNDSFVPNKQYDSWLLNDGDDVIIMYIMSGG